MPQFIFFLLLAVRKSVLFGAPDVKEVVIMAVIVKARVSTIVRTIVVKQTAMEHVLVVQCLVAPIVLAKEPTLVVIVGVVVKSGVSMYVLLEVAAVVLVIVLIVLVPPMQE